MPSQIAVDSDKTEADRVTWVDSEQMEYGSLLEVSRKMKHFHSGAKQGVYKDVVLTLDCIGKRDEAALEDLFKEILFYLHL